MSAGEISPTRLGYRSNESEIHGSNAQTGPALPDVAVNEEHKTFTTGTSQPQPPPRATSQTGAGAVGSTAHRTSSRRSQSSKKPGKLADTAHSNSKRLSEAQQELEITTATISSSSSTDSDSSTVSSVAPRESLFQDLKRKQGGVVLNPEGPPRFPGRNDFPGLSIKVLERVIDVDVRNCVIIQPDHSNAVHRLHSLALRLQKEVPESVFISLPALRGSSSDLYAHQGEAEDGKVDTEVLKESRKILVDVIKDVLIAKCHFSPRNIIILGHCQGGTIALAAAASWDKIELGGVISVGGLLPAFIPQFSTVKAKTPVLILSGPLGNINDTALRQIKEHFPFMDHDIRRSSNDDIPEADDIGTLLDFFAHRLRSEEWTKQAVISFDGGGIRGYGSLLILRALMDKIGEEEKRLDPTVESSFAPCDYKPMPKKTSGGLDDLIAEGVGATATQGLPNSSLFLPCHYFTYAAGTSTGGLISIMLSRFRMTVDDCIKEYETLGAKVFGNPRPLVMGAILWHKFDHRTLEAAIRDVTQRYSEPGDFGGRYAMDEDVCKSMVLAYAASSGADYPYLFRTYRTHVPLHRAKTKGPHGTTGIYGDAAALPIWQIARATSAAPTYFRPMEIPRGNRPGLETFKDGGFGSNNPSLEAYNDVTDKHGGTSQNMGPFISIGTGIPPIDFFSKKKGNLNDAIANFKAALKHPSRTVGAHRTMERLSIQDNKERFPYFRFDGGERLGKIALDEWKGHRFTRLTGKNKNPGCITLENMFVATAAYLAEPKVQRDLNECARILVRRRQLRMRNRSEWDRYASFSYYDCNVEGCATQRSTKAQDFREHVRKFHWKVAEHEMEQKMRECRRVYGFYRQHPPDPTPPAG